MLNWLRNLFGAKKPISIEYVVLDEDAFYTEYHKAFEKLNLTTESEKQAFRDRMFTAQGAVEKALKRKWKPESDFEVGWDIDYCYHTCGGIYSERVFCGEYVKTIARALLLVDPLGRWTYHTACEIVLTEETEPRGEFFVRGNTCYINGTTMTPKWRAQLGCPR